MVLADFTEFCGSVSILLIFIVFDYCYSLILKMTPSISFYSIFSQLSCYTIVFCL